MNPKKSLPAVKPPRRVYVPKYPSFADPNPLLHPETMPYPFTARFANWAAVGGMTGMLLFGGGDLPAQESRDSLYNPFPLENARVPYRPVSFGTGLPQRLSTRDAIVTIRKAFASSGIELEENVWLEGEDIGAYLNGYSKKDKIGFLLLEYGRMDESFRLEYGNDEPVDTDKIPQPEIKELIAAYREDLEKKFVGFIADKDTYLQRHTRPDSEGLAGEFAAQLAGLEPEEALLDTFVHYHNDYTIHLATERRTGHETAGEFLAMIDKHTTDLSLKAVLLNLTGRRSATEGGEEYTALVLRGLADLDTTKDEMDFGQGLLNLMTFLNYRSDSYILRHDVEYQKLKLAIMKHQPSASWVRQLNKLASYSDRKTISIQEARRVDERNKSGDLQVAPISLLSDLMIVPDAPYFSKEIQEEQEQLNKELRQAKGITDEMLARKKAEIDAVDAAYNFQEMARLANEVRLEKMRQRRDAITAINDKYTAMETITAEERAEFKRRSDELRERADTERQNAADQAKMKTLLRLERQVKMYITWARTQQGW